MSKKQTRKTITKKIRFEVFKRDNFTCQYCGRMAPDVILEIDHINPICNNGDNDIMNLITSCFECNRGKGKRQLTQNEELKKQQEQLRQLNEKRNQLEMLLSWKKELEKFNDEQVEKIEEIFISVDVSFTEHGKEKCKKEIKKYGFDEVYESTKISMEQYYDENDKKSILKVFDYIFKICANRKLQKNNPNLYKINYLVKIAHNRLPYCNDDRLRIFLNKHFCENDFEILKFVFCNVKNWTNLREELEDLYGEIL